VCYENSVRRFPKEKDKCCPRACVFFYGIIVLHHNAQAMRQLKFGALTIILPPLATLGRSALGFFNRVVDLWLLLTLQQHDTTARSLLEQTTQTSRRKETRESTKN
jgi:hypothetical protein